MQLMHLFKQKCCCFIFCYRKKINKRKKNTVSNCRYLQVIGNFNHPFGKKISHEAVLFSCVWMFKERTPFELKLTLIYKHYLQYKKSVQYIITGGKEFRKFRCSSLKSYIIFMTSFRNGCEYMFFVCFKNKCMHIAY